MKKYLILFVAAISTTFFVGCDSDDDFNPPNYVTFATNDLDVTVNENESSSFDVTVYTANTTGSDRTLSIEVDEESTLGMEALTLPETVTVPANSNEATFTVNVTDTNLDNAGETLVLRVGEEQGLFTGDPLTINIARVCEFDPAGNYVNDSEWFEAEFPVDIEAGASANQYVIPDLFEEGTDITFTVNEDLTVTVPAQNAWMHASYGQASVTGRAGSRVEACNGRVILVLQHTVEAGSFGTFTETFTKQADAVDGSDGEDTDGDDTDGDDTDGDGTDGDDTDGDDNDE